MDWKHLLFSFEGRVNRAKYWLVALVTIGLSIAIAFLLIAVALNSIAGFSVLALLILIPTYVGVVVGVKRLHDRNKSGWWLLLYYLVPGILTGIAGDSYEGTNLALNVVGHAISLWALIDLGFLRGTAGPNDYGPDPLERQA